jgi:hypothetical protein
LSVLAVPDELDLEALPVLMVLAHSLHQLLLPVVVAAALTMAVPVDRDLVVVVLVAQHTWGALEIHRLEAHHKEIQEETISYKPVLAPVVAVAVLVQLAAMQHPVRLVMEATAFLTQ